MNFRNSSPRLLSICPVCTSRSPLDASRLLLDDYGMLLDASRSLLDTSRSPPPDLSLIFLPCSPPPTTIRLISAKRPAQAHATQASSGHYASSQASTTQVQRWSDVPLGRLGWRTRVPAVRLFILVYVNVLSIL
ncbi:hypothetical protein K523DRAFT_21285 [Schizophyllum commune Tattone D]|nr:hypothetical protein K523DRAFT_21285 [Schizophyllum commune Tattone D]